MPHWESWRPTWSSWLSAGGNREPRRPYLVFMALLPVCGSRGGPWRPIDESHEVTTGTASKKPSLQHKGAEWEGGKVPERKGGHTKCKTKCHQFGAKCHQCNFKTFGGPPGNVKQQKLASKAFGGPLPKQPNSSRIRVQTMRNSDHEHCRNVAYETH